MIVIFEVDPAHYFASEYSLKYSFLHTFSSG